MSISDARSHVGKKSRKRDISMVTSRDNGKREQKMLWRFGESPGCVSALALATGAFHLSYRKFLCSWSPLFLVKLSIVPLIRLILQDDYLYEESVDRQHGQGAYQAEE